MANAFQRNAFQKNAFQIRDLVAAVVKLYRSRRGSFSLSRKVVGPRLSRKKIWGF